MLAGGIASPAFAAMGGVRFRALADLNGLPMVRYVLRALKDARSISRVVLVAPSGYPDEPEADARVVGDGDLADNILAGVEYCPGAEHVLLITEDVPFIRGSEVDDFIAQALAASADVAYAAVSMDACRKQFPMMKRTAIRTTDGPVTGGNLVLQRAATVEKQAEFIRRAYEARKKPVRLARMIGIGNVLKLLAGRLSLSEIEAAASRVMGVRCRLILTPHAALATDLDRPEDLVQARVLLRPVH